MPDGSSLIVALFVAGFLLLAAEVFVPGLVLGFVGLLCLAGSVGLVFVQHGPVAGVIAFFLVSGLTLGGFLLWLSIFPRTFVGRRIILQRSQPIDPGAENNRSLIGEDGTALTALRPAGTARIAGKRVDVTTVGEFLAEGSSLVVVAADGMRVVVRSKEALASPVASV
jgi:membrane-bound serine protease (ClpP class)